MAVAASIAAPGQLNLDEPPSWGSRSVDAFEKLEQIGEGTYGQVYMAREKDTGEIVALKKVRMDNEKEGFPITAIREIKILKKLKHDHVIRLKEIVTSKAQENNKYKGSIYMVFEYMDHDLTGLSDRPGMRFTIPQIKCYMTQLLKGLHYCHSQGILHRDIKGSNLLIDNNGILKLADFGLARTYGSNSNAQLTNRVITLWYRPPELLLGSNKYGPAVDMWSVGCIFAELLLGKPILPGKNEFEQLQLIFNLCGSPDETNWPGVSKLQWWQQFKPERPLKRRLKDVYKSFDKNALDLVEKMLTLDPAKRTSAKDALDHDYFWQDPLPCEPANLPKYESSHEYQTKKKRQQQRLQDEQAKRQKANLPAPHGRLPPGGQQQQLSGLQQQQQPPVPPMHAKLPPRGGSGAGMGQAQGQYQGRSANAGQGRPPQGPGGYGAGRGGGSTYGGGGYGGGAAQGGRGGSMYGAYGAPAAYAGQVPAGRGMVAPPPYGVPGVGGAAAYGAHGYGQPSVAMTYVDIDAQHTHGNHSQGLPPVPYPAPYQSGYPPPAPASSADRPDRRQQRNR